jgi:serine/threonine protein phosphatase PrpC
MSDLTDALARANRVVAAATASNPRLRGAGCTAAALQLSGGRCTVAWVGDVRVLRFRDGELTELTRVHSLENDYLRRHVPPAEAAKFSGILVRALGMSDKVEVEVAADTTREGDVYVLASGPAYAAVGESLLASIVAANRGDPHACTRALMEGAAANGARDVVSALTIALGQGNDSAAAADARWDAEPRFALEVAVEEDRSAAERERVSRFDRAVRSWRTAKTPRDAWRRFRSWMVQNGITDGDVPVDAVGTQSHDLFVGPTTRALVLFEKHHVMTMFMPDGRGSDRASRWRIATGSVPFAPRALDVDLIRAEVRVLGGVPVGLVGDLDPHGLHVFGALRSGDLDAPDIRGRRLRIEWLGIDDAWLQSARKTDRTLRARQIRMGWVEREYWKIVKGFAPDVHELIGDESFALLESGLKVEADDFGDVMGERVRNGLSRLRKPRA